MKNYIKENLEPMAIGIALGLLTAILIGRAEDLAVKVALILAGNQ